MAPTTKKPEKKGSTPKKQATPKGKKAPAKKQPPKKRAPRSPEKKILAEQQKKQEEEKKRGRGRPTKLTPTVQEDIVKALRGGMYMETAAAYAGIDKDTLYEWLKLGARGESEEHIHFSDAVKKAVAEAELTDLLLIKKAASDGTWQAAAWRLERRFRERWGRSISVSKDNIKDMSDEELIALLEDADSEGTGAP